MTKITRLTAFVCAVLCCLSFIGCTFTTSTVDLASIPAFSRDPFVVLNNNQPQFSPNEITTRAFEQYSALDHLGRCGVATACIGRELMPTEERGNISSVKPSGWQSLRFDFVDGKSLYNRCHLIGFQLTGENANEKNLITGTRYLNVEGMLPFENMVADYIKETGHHVMYRVTPLFDGSDLVARGVQMEAYSVEDNGEGICFNVYCYNAQPGVAIDYTDGYAQKSTDAAQLSDESGQYILNINSKKIHKNTCHAAQSIAPSNRQQYTGALNNLLLGGFERAGCCFE